MFAKISLTERGLGLLSMILLSYSSGFIRNYWFISTIFFEPFRNDDDINFVSFGIMKTFLTGDKSLADYWTSLILKSCRLNLSGAASCRGEYTLIYPIRFIVVSWSYW
jgi:hypothetical protein